MAEVLAWELGDGSVETFTPLFDVMDGVPLVPPGVDFVVLDAADLPPRRFRDAWRLHPEKGVKEDLKAAKELVKRQIAATKRYGPAELERMAGEVDGHDDLDALEVYRRAKIPDLDR